MVVAQKPKKQVIKFVLDCKKVAYDNIIDPTNLGTYFRHRVKVDNKLNNLGEKIQITFDNAQVTINAELPFSKRYIKYLAKKYLKKHQVRDYIRVVATNKTTYELRYFAMNEEQAES